MLTDNKYWNLCDSVFCNHWQGMDPKSLRKLMKKQLDYSYDAGPEHVGIIAGFKSAYINQYDGKAREALVAL